MTVPDQRIVIKIVFPVNDMETGVACVAIERDGIPEKRYGVERPTPSDAELQGVPAKGRRYRSQSMPQNERLKLATGS